jgi:hypothetical protein
MGRLDPEVLDESPEIIRGEDVDLADDDLVHDYALPCVRK